MLEFKPNPDRAKLGFRQAVVTSFKFLRKYGFHRVRTEPTLVRYETIWPFSRKKLFVNVYHGRGSYVMGVEVGRCGETELTFPLPSIVKWAGGKEAEEFEKRTMFQASTREDVQQLVPKMAELVGAYAAPFLRGDKEAYGSATKQMRRESLLYEKEMRLRQEREKAEAAWHGKDYEQVISIYEPLQDELSRSEEMRLAYAKKQVLQPIRPRR